MDNQTAIITLIFLFIIYKLIVEYYYYNDTDHLFITSDGDFHKYESEGRYNNSPLYHEYKNSLCEDDRLFIRDLMCHEILNYKSNRPSFKKKCKSMTKNIILTSLGGYLILNNSIGKSFKQNTLGYFMTSMI